MEPQKKLTDKTKEKPREEPICSENLMIPNIAGENLRETESDDGTDHGRHHCISNNSAGSFSLSGPSH